MRNIAGGGKIADEGQMCAPPFFADQADEDQWIMGYILTISFLIGTIFGAIHLIGWNFFFSFSYRKDCLAGRLYYDHSDTGNGIYSTYRWRYA